MKKCKRYILVALPLFLALSICIDKTVRFYFRFQSIQPCRQYVKEQQNACDQYRTYFIRHIDSLYNDTLYSVCYIGAHGDTLRARIPIYYENPDTTIWTYFYLRNNGDTILYENHSEADNTGLIHQVFNQCTDKSIYGSITSEEQDVINEIQQYLTDYKGLEN